MIAVAHQGSWALGVVAAANSAGGLLGSPIVPPLRQRISPGVLLVLSTCCCAAGIMLMALTRQPILLAALIGTCALLISISSVLMTTIRTVATPDHLQARVNNTTGLLFMSATAAVCLVAGSLLGFVPSNGVFLIFGSLFLVLALAAIGTRTHRLEPAASTPSRPEHAPEPERRTLGRPDAA